VFVVPLWFFRGIVFVPLWFIRVTDAARLSHKDTRSLYIKEDAAQRLKLPLVCADTQLRRDNFTSWYRGANEHDKAAKFK
jgi:hypothetical protein